MAVFTFLLFILFWYILNPTKDFFLQVKCPDPFFWPRCHLYLSSVSIQSFLHYIPYRYPSNPPSLVHNLFFFVSLFLTLLFSILDSRLIILTSSINVILPSCVWIGLFPPPPLSHSGSSTIWYYSLLLFSIPILVESSILSFASFSIRILIHYVFLFPHFSILPFSFGSFTLHTNCSHSHPISQAQGEKYPN